MNYIVSCFDSICDGHQFRRGGFGYISNLMIEEVALEELPNFLERNWHKVVTPNFSIN